MRASVDLVYRGYEIGPDPDAPAFAAYAFAHKDYDGPEDSRCGNAPTIDACKQEIDDQMLERLENLAAAHKEKYAAWMAVPGCGSTGDIASDLESRRVLALMRQAREAYESALKEHAEHVR